MNASRRVQLRRVWKEFKTRGVIGEGQTTDRINHSPNFFHFNNQQSTINNHHSTIINPMEKMQSGGLRTPAEKCRPPR